MIVNIQILRAFAAIIVVIFHAQSMVLQYGYTYAKYDFLLLNIQSWGSFGIDLFFVISGYIMFMINDKKSRQPIEFFFNRINRVLPIYWLLTVFLFLLYTAMPSIFGEAKISFSRFISSLLFISHQMGYQFPTLYVGWTLEYEMFFYLLFSLTLCLKTDNVKRLLLLSIFIALSVFLGWYGPRAVEFLYGGVIFIFFKKNDFFMHYKNNKFCLLIIMALLYVILMPNISENNKFIFWGISASIIFSSALLIKDINIKFLKKLGDASYPIYLIQVFSLPAMGEILVKIAPNLSGIWVLVLMLIFTIASGHLLHITIENKLTTFSKTYLTMDRLFSIKIRR